MLETHKVIGSAIKELGSILKSHRLADDANDITQPKVGATRLILFCNHILIPKTVHSEFRKIRIVPFHFANMEKLMLRGVRFFF